MDVESDFCRHGEEATGSNYTIYLEVAAATPMKMKIKVNGEDDNEYDNEDHNQIYLEVAATPMKIMMKITMKMRVKSLH